jgi:hypothetical protein
VDTLPNFEVRQDLAVYRPRGQVSVPQAVALMTQAITLAREARVSKLIADISGWIDLPSPSVTDRYFFIQDWALAARGQLRLAMVAPPELIDPEKFGVAVARNRGLVADVFTSEDEALAWLQGPGRPS